MSQNTLYSVQIWIYLLLLRESGHFQDLVDFWKSAEVEGLLDCPGLLAMWVQCSKGRARVAKQVLAISLTKCENPK